METVEDDVQGRSEGGGTPTEPTQIKLRRGPSPAGQGSEVRRGVQVQVRVKPRAERAQVPSVLAATSKGKEGRSGRGG